MEKIAHDSQGYSPEEVATLKRYMPLVRRVVSRVAGKITQDLLDSGMFGLLDAIHKFDSSHGTNFATYARLRVRGAVIDRLREQDKLGRTQRHKVTVLSRTINTLEQRLGRAPSSTEISEELGVSPEELSEIWSMLDPEEVPVEELEGHEDDDEGEHTSPTPGGKVHDVFDLGGPDPLARLMQAENARLMSTMLEQLPDRERQCITLSFYENLTLKEVGERLGFTESRASQIRTRGLKMLRRLMARYQ